MTPTQSRRTSRSILGLVALVLAGLAFAAATNAAGHQDNRHRVSERLVVRGDATVVDAPCEAGICLELTDASFRGTPVGTGDYTGALKLKLADAFPNGEGGACAPVQGSIVLGPGSPDRLVLAVAGDSCQDGTGDPATSSFTGLARFTIKSGTGEYAGARGSGLASFSEDAADHDRMTLIGHISR